MCKCANGNVKGGRLRSMHRVIPTPQAQRCPLSRGGCASTPYCHSGGSPGSEITLMCARRGVRVQTCATCATSADAAVGPRPERRSAEAPTRRLLACAVVRTERGRAEKGGERRACLGSTSVLFGRLSERSGRLPRADFTGDVMLSPCHVITRRQTSSSVLSLPCVRVSL